MSPGDDAVTAAGRDPLFGPCVSPPSLSPAPTDDEQREGRTNEGGGGEGVEVLAYPSFSSLPFPSLVLSFRHRRPPVATAPTAAHMQI